MMRFCLGVFVFSLLVRRTAGASCSELDPRMFECQDDASHCCINDGTDDGAGGFALVRFPPPRIIPALKTIDSNYASFRKARPKINRAKKPDAPSIYREAWEATKDDIKKSAFCALLAGGECEDDQVEIPDLDFVPRCSTLYDGTFRNDCNQFEKFNQKVEQLAAGVSCNANPVWKNLNGEAIAAPLYGNCDDESELGSLCPITCMYSANPIVFAACSATGEWRLPLSFVDACSPPCNCPNTFEWVIDGDVLGGGQCTGRPEDAESCVITCQQNRDVSFRPFCDCDAGFPLWGINNAVLDRCLTCERGAEKCSANPYWYDAETSKPLSDANVECDKRNPGDICFIQCNPSGVFTAKCGCDGTWYGDAKICATPISASIAVSGITSIAVVSVVVALLV